MIDPSKLHDLLCEDFERLLKSKEMTAQDRKVLIDFLKHNNISASGGPNSPLGSLVDNLPFDENDNMVIQ